MNDSIKQSQVKEIPPSIFYKPEFITTEEESTLLKQVYAAPKPRWTHLSNRRLQNWGGLPHPKGMVSEDLPKWLQCYTDKISDLGVFGGHKANHVLVNEYEAGQGIMPHVDGPLYFPTVSTISLGSHTLLDFYRPIREADTEGNMSHDSHEPSSSSTSLEDRYMCSILLQPRSLILVKDEMYDVYLHGIEERKSDTITDKIMNLDQCDGVGVGDDLERTTRVSLTIRYVPKLLKAQLFLGRKR